MLKIIVFDNPGVFKTIFSLALVFLLDSLEGFYIHIIYCLILLRYAFSRKLQREAYIQEWSLWTFSQSNWKRILSLVP